ncbi:MAG: tRNA 2-thiouridine(34) synthase MnmA [Steroidobacteraceae bacterium]
MAMSPARILVGMSGGVDSAVAALLLKRAGHDVHGLYMSNWEEDDAYCTSAQDYQDARACAQELGIVLHRVSFAAQYREQVFQNFLDEYRAGRTPNPDVLCNREIKFGICLDYARRLGASRFATGHYARLEQLDDGPALLKARDAAKDQSYFLHAVPRAQFREVLFPLGELHKEEVREQARSAGLPVYDKPDSTGICFIGERPFTEFLARYLPEEPGPIETGSGEVLGQHRGLHFYTLGQRGGLEIGGRSGHSEEPWYVAHKVRARNALIVVQRHELMPLQSHAVRAAALNWLDTVPEGAFATAAKLRYRQPDQAARAILQPDGRLLLEFAQPQRAATPGQFAVLYREQRCLGGGVIEETL